MGRSQANWEQKMRKFLSMALTTSILAVGLGMATAARAEYPERPVTFIVPWPPGDLEDQLTRVITEEFTKMYSVPAKVVNVPGGGAVVGATQVSQASPDGYTIGSFVVDVPTMHIIKANAPYTRDTFEPVGIFMTYPFALVAKKDAPYNNLAELAAYAKSNPVKLGHFGYDLIPSMETFVAAKQLGFKYSADAAFDMLDCSTVANGDADVVNTTMALMLSCLKDVKVIAAYTDTPLSVMPDGKLLSAQVPGLDTTLWNGLFVPKGTPQDVKDKIEAAAKAAMTSDRALSIARETGVGVYWQDAVASAARIEQDYKASEKLVQDLK
jgi:tripartite-type tricarboxylate transporter receptor subunit TctC